MTQSDTNTNRPTATLRDGLIQASIWKNVHDGKTRYNIEFVRRYEVDGEWKDSHSFGPTELLRVAHLANQAYGKVLQLRQEEP